MSMARPAAGLLRADRPAGAVRLNFELDGETIEAFEGETVVGALLAAGIRSLRATARQGDHRGPFCNMGVCCECLMEIDGHSHQRACQRLVEEGMKIRGAPISRRDESLS